MTKLRKEAEFYGVLAKETQLPVYYTIVNCIRTQILMLKLKEKKQPIKLEEGVQLIAEPVAETISSVVTSATNIESEVVRLYTQEKKSRTEIAAELNIIVQRVRYFLLKNKLI